MRNHSRTITGAALLVAALSLNGCSTLDAAKCESMDWEARGARDALRGMQRDAVNTLDRSCAEFGVSADEQAYHRGWDEGIQNYCSKEKGWEVGMSSASYGHTCPENLEAQFYSAYQLARSVKESKTEVATARRELDKVLEKLAEEDLDDEKRRYLKKEKRRLKKALASAKADEAKAIREARDMGFSI